MGYIENSALPQISDSALEQTFRYGLLLSPHGIGLSNGQVISWDEYFSLDFATNNKQNFDNNQTRSICQYAGDLGYALTFTVYDHAAMTPYHITGDQAMRVIKDYKFHRTGSTGEDRDKFSLLFDYVSNYNFGPNLELVCFSIPYHITRPLWNTKRGTGGRRRKSKPSEKN